MSIEPDLHWVSPLGSRHDGPLTAERPAPKDHLVAPSRHREGGDGRCGNLRHR
jgi:hypothetical protein